VFFTELNLKGNKLNDKRLLKLVDQCHSKQVLEYIRQHCTSASSGIDTSAAGKGKFKKKKQLANDSHEKMKKHANSSHRQEDVSNLAN
jgi:DNA transposition AAA+ family ATPase